MMKHIVVSALLLLAAGCTTTTSTQLFNDLGGSAGIDAIAGQFIAEIGENAAIRPYFMNTNLERFHEQFSVHLCKLAGGPCEYTGDTMLQVHQGMTVTESDFNQTVDLLIAAMNKRGVPHPVQNQLLQRMAPLRTAIIYH